MVQNDMFQEEINPEFAALPGAGREMPVLREGKVVPDFAFFADGGDEGEPAAGKGEPAAEETGFPVITKRLEDVPHTGFADPNYYKVVLSGEGDIAQRVHTVLQKYINCADLKDKGVFRQQLTTAYWDFLAGVAKKSAGRIAVPKKFLLRFGILHPVFLNPDTRTFFSKITVDNEYSTPVYYLDEWFKAVGTGIIRNSTTDEVQSAKTNTNVRLQQLLEKATGKRDGAKGLLIAKDKERQNMEKVLTGRMGTVVAHAPLPGVGVNACYTEPQKQTFGELQELIKQLLKADRELELFLKDYYQADEDVKTLREKVETEGGSAEMDVQAVDTEFGTIRQMAKMTIGRQGNHFPMLTSEYFRCGPNDVATRENVIARLAWIESIDPEAFCRVYKNRLNRIVPIVILLPTYGDTGICWEPFDRYNRATSRGRIALPMYPKSLTIALLSAVADLRWQVAKEKASFYWMEEGLTGNYYQWFNAQKIKGDVKEYFIQDYIIWMTKESEGTQKLDKEIRGIFWRYMPFTQSVKEKLKTRSFTYQELYQRDVNRTMSDGY
ncbi:MAG: hypothetical protein LBH57_08045 [Treponema sp.]|jgi:hypothetical protein|nr:hypothetical protein [Treponema sp.]